MKKFLCILLSLAVISFVFVGCGEKKILHCDNCGKEVTVEKDSQMNDDWTILCADCEKELGLDDIIPER